MSDLKPTHRYIDWSQAPKWARYAAMDADGEWFWFEQEPKPDSDGVWRASSGRSEKITPHWTDSLQTRPETT